VGSAHAGEVVFFKKGAYVLPPHPADVLCVQLYFIPDCFVRETLVELTTQLPAAADLVDAALVIPVMPDVALSAFLHAMSVYFAAQEDPPEALLKLKLKELLTGILLSRSNPALSAYLRSLATHDVPPTITTICRSRPSRRCVTAACLRSKEISGSTTGPRPVSGCSSDAWRARSRCCRRRA
jgi:hypothetical protein